MNDWTHCETAGAVFRPRLEYNGRPLIPELAQRRGEHLTLQAMWLQGEDDPYPGEWALSGPDHADVFGRSWISSGDVEKFEELPAANNQGSGEE